ncbi:hypothetical protein ANN_07867 [Periplaneta americana]|uniref:Uncharacterized protein n=1 Tax=Periplaneta americana TaxID=6978 RepID=A0ABQ8SZV5_PERAM|nr:hypothetical protein ANN_07867 [Periplaneta americana]
MADLCGGGNESPDRLKARLKFLTNHARDIIKPKRGWMQLESNGDIRVFDSRTATNILSQFFLFSRVSSPEMNQRYGPLLGKISTRVQQHSRGITGHEIYFVRDRAYLLVFRTEPIRVRLEELHQWRKLMTPSGLEIATFRLAELRPYRTTCKEGQAADLSDLEVNPSVEVVRLRSNSQECESHLSVLDPKQAAGRSCAAH